MSWLAADASSPPAGNSVGYLVLLLRACNALERWAAIPLPLPGFAAFKAIKREVAWADVVHLHDGLYLAHILAHILARQLGKPVVLTQHIASMPYRNLLLRLVMRAMNRLITRSMLAAADQVVFISNVTAKAFADVAYRRPPRTIFNGVDTELFRPPPMPPKGSRVQTFATRAAPADRAVCRSFVEKKGLSVYAGPPPSERRSIGFLPVGAVWTHRNGVSLTFLCVGALPRLRWRCSIGRAMCWSCRVPAKVCRWCYRKQWPRACERRER